MPVFILVQKMDSGELKYFKFDQVVKNLQTTKEENKSKRVRKRCENLFNLRFFLVEEYEEESDKSKGLRYTYGVKITKFIRYTPFDSHIDLNEL
jgi:plasmid replication initiation protein